MFRARRYRPCMLKQARHIERLTIFVKKTLQKNHSPCHDPGGRFTLNLFYKQAAKIRDLGNNFRI